jgi:hypothetical protein
MTSGELASASARGSEARATGGPGDRRRRTAPRVIARGLAPAGPLPRFRWPLAQLSSRSTICDATARVSRLGMTVAF